MSSTVLLALVTTLLAAVPMVISRRRLALNPAFLVFLVVLWSILLKVLYLGQHSASRPSATQDLPPLTSDFLFGGTVVAAVAVGGYVAGYLLPGRHTPRFRLPAATWDRSPPPYTRWAVLAMAALAVAAFVLYCLSSGTDPFQLPFSMKRFSPRQMGVETRFQYPPYYFFKISTLAGPLAYATLLLSVWSDERREKRFYSTLVVSLFCFALMLSHFASLRLYILLVLSQIGLLVLFFHNRRRLVLALLLSGLTAVSFLSITFVLRPPVSSGNLDATDDGAIHGGAGIQTKMEHLTRRIGASAFEGRYFMDVGKLARIAAHFPDETPFLWGRGLLGRFSREDRADNTASQRPIVGVGRFLAVEVFSEPGNSIPAGYAGELYINFGWLGLLAGFLLLGASHRLIYNYLVGSDLSIFVVGCLVVVIPSLTLVLLNSGMVSAAARSAMDLGVIVLVWLPLAGSRPRPGPSPG